MPRNSNNSDRSSCLSCSRLTAAEAEDLLFKAGFVWRRSKGSHRIYAKGIAEQVLTAIEEVVIEPMPLLNGHGCAEAFLAFGEDFEACSRFENAASLALGMMA